MTAITRSEGIPTGVMGPMAGGGYSGATDELDAVVAAAAEALAGAYGMDVTIRFNSDRESGGAWLRTHTADGVWCNAEVGICADVTTERKRQAWERFARQDAEVDAEGAACWLDALARHPVGTITVCAHITAAVAGSREAELRELDSDGWRDGAGEPYHHGKAASVEDALARCLRFAPPGTIQVQ